MSDSNLANRVIRCEGEVFNVPPYVKAKNRILCLILISDEIEDTQLYIQAVDNMIIHRL